MDKKAMPAGRQVYEFISQQTSDPIIEWETCKISKESFPIFQSDLDFYQKASPVFGGKKYEIPIPTLCPEERERRRLLFRNERKLYKRKCDATGENMVSMYSPDKNVKVYTNQFRWSDKRNPLDYGISFDQKKTFKEHFEILLHTVPLVNLIGSNNQNSKYVNIVADCKNCYIVIESSNCEDCYHCYWIQKCKRCVDACFSHECEHCYEIDNCFFSYDLQYSRDCKSCSSSRYLYNCENCSHCIGCTNLQNAQYCIFNEQKTKEEFAEYLQGLDLNHVKQTYNDLLEKSGVKFANVVNVEKSFGNYMNDVKNCVLCNHSYDAESCRYSEHVWRNAKDVMDASTAGRNANLIYESINAGIDIHNILFCAVSWSGSHDMLYCFNCLSSNHCFGCVSLRDKEYCVFNKQYSKKEYEELVPQIIEHMQKTGERGEFFDPSLSLFGYNETIAQEYFPLTKDEATARGYSRQENNYDPIIPEGVETLTGDQIPSDITQANDDILKKIFICEVSGRPFRIIQQELDFYRQHKISLPRKHPDVRHEERTLYHRLLRSQHLRNCSSCKNEILSVYPQNRSGNILCEKCYNKEVY